MLQRFSVRRVCQSNPRKSSCELDMKFLSSLVRYLDMLSAYSFRALPDTSFLPMITLNHLRFVSGVQVVVMSRDCFSRVRVVLFLSLCFEVEVAFMTTHFLVSS